MIRRAVVGLGLGVAALAALSLAPGSLSAAESASVHADSEGWWNVTATPVSVPPSPLGPLPATPAVDVPEGSVPVTMRLGQPARVGAIGVVLDAQRGSTVSKLVMHLKEADATGQQGAEPAVRACPVTSFLVPEPNGPPENAPQEDCDVAHADGVRADDGTWTFDLTAIATAWLDPFGTVQPNGVRLDPVGDPPATFQVAFTGFEVATFDADITPGQPTTDPFATGGAGGFSGSTGGSFDLGGSFDSGSSDFSAPGTEVTAPVTTPGAGSPAPDKRPRVAAAPVSDSRAGQTLGNWPPALVALLVGAALLAALTGLALGPAGRSSSAPRRQGGVGRALARRLAATDRP